jgi:hypothetical protein
VVAGISLAFRSVADGPQELAVLAGQRTASAALIAMLHRNLD